MAMPCKHDIVIMRGKSWIFQSLPLLLASDAMLSALLPWSCSSLSTVNMSWSALSGALADMAAEVVGDTSAGVLKAFLALLVPVTREKHLVVESRG